MNLFQITSTYLKSMFSLFCKKLLLTKISMVPLEILVGMDKAWKKEVLSGPRPVFWGGSFTATGARAPALAGAAT